MGSFNGSATKVYCFTAHTGEVIWQTSLTGKSSSSFALQSNLLIISMEDSIYALDTNNSMQLWNTAIPERVNINIPPVISDELVYFFNLKNKLCALNLNDGIPVEILGNIEIVSVNSFSISPSSIFIGSGLGRLIKYTAGNYQSWENNLGIIDSISSYPVLSNQRVVAGSVNGYLYIWDLTSSNFNDVIIERPFKNAIRSSPAISDNWIFVCSVDGELKAYSS